MTVFEALSLMIAFATLVVDTAKNLNNYIYIMDASLNLEGGIHFVLA